MKKKSQKAEGRLAWSIMRFAEATDLSPNFVRQQIKDGALTAVRLGERRLVIPDAEAQRYLEMRSR